MAGHTVPIDFRVNPAKISNPVERQTLLQDLLPLVDPFTGPLSQVSESSLPGGHHMTLYASDTSTLTVKLYGNGLVTATVEYYTDQPHKHRIVNDDGRRLERQVREKFGATVAKVLPAIKRGPHLNPYFTSSDDRLLEYDVDQLLFQEQSPYQKVEIYHTKSFGNLLVLDDLQNMAESDLPYTRGLMNYGSEDYRDKEVLILGGGDGALLWELLKEKPKFVTMIDIDETVMRSCGKHLKSANGDCLDNYDGQNYKIIVGDALAYMKERIAEGKQYHYVFGDLTDVPISPTVKGEHWDFMRTIMDLANSLIRADNGKYMTHAIGIQCEGALKMFEEQLGKLVPAVTFSRTSCHVPSFMERWCYYQVSRKT